MQTIRRIPTAAALLALLLAASSPAQTPNGTNGANGTHGAIGSIAGTIFNASNGQPIPNAIVTTKQLATLAATTDTTGRYQLSLPPGKYTVQVKADNYFETAIEEVEVAAGQVTDTSTVLGIRGTSTTVDVVEKIGAVAATTEAMLTERKLSPVVTDSLSSDEIRNSTASDAAGALEKVTGVSVVGDGYVYVRGLGERYSATMLNNALIPTTEPEKRVVPLDLFPSNLIDSIKVLKTYTPDLPGEFAGGLVELSTVDFPTRPTLRVSTSFGFNTRTSFEPFLDYKGGNRDFFGFNSGARDLPSAIPADRRISVGAFSQTELQQLGRSFENNWEPTRVDSMRPEQSYSLVGGGTFGKFGVVGAFTLNNRPQYQKEFQQYNRLTGIGNTIGPFNILDDYNSYYQGARLGGVLNLAYRINSSHRLAVRNTLTHDSDKEARTIEGFDNEAGGRVRSERLRWIERGLLATQVESEHLLPRLGNSIVNLLFTYSRSNRDEPDLREVYRLQRSDGAFVYSGGGAGNLRFFNYLNENIYEPGATWTIPFFKGGIAGVFKFGGRYQQRERNFDARRFFYTLLNATGINLAAGSNTIFSPDNIRPGVLELREVTRGTDSYDAGMDVYAGFGMVDLALSRKLRLVGGVRVERANIDVLTVDPLSAVARPATAALRNTDPLPSVNLIYSIAPRQNLRFSFSQTVSRPDFRELSPFDFTNVVGGFTVIGNPNLRRAKIHNLDFRYEFFPSADQVIAMSFFYKKFKDPIEQTIEVGQALRQTFINAKSANNYGIELEFRRRLNFLSPKLRGWLLQSNVTVVDSNVQISPDQQLALTSASRPLTGQSRYIINAQVEWTRPQWRSSGRFYANSVSRRITDVGSFGVPDIYQERNVFLDFVYQYDIRENGRWSVKFSAENLADNFYRFTQGTEPFRNYRLGRTFSVGTSFNIF